MIDTMDTREGEITQSAIRQKRIQVHVQRVEKILDQSPDAIATEKQKNKTSRLSRSVTKVKDGVRRSVIPELERLTDRDFTQEELLALVKTAEAEELKEVLERLEEDGLSPAALAEIGAIDIEALAQKAAELTEHMQKNEESLTEIAAKEKNGTKVPKEEFLTLWNERGELMGTLSEIAWQRQAYTQTFADQAMIGLMQKLFAPLNKLLWKMWKELNRKNPGHVALPALRSAAYIKTRKAHEGKWGFKEELQFRKWRKEASPADLAIRITALQMDRSSSPVTSTDLALAV